MRSSYSVQVRDGDDELNSDWMGRGRARESGKSEKDIWGTSGKGLGDCPILRMMIGPRLVTQSSDKEVKMLSHAQGAESGGNEWFCFYLILCGGRE